METYIGKYNPLDKRAFKISRSKIELFHSCKRCFYLDRRVGIKRPPQFPFNLNNAVDELLKNEFDGYRASQTVPQLLKDNNIDAVPFQHQDIERWRNNFQGVSHYHSASNFYVFGAIDDVWVNKNGELIVVDYKATSKRGEVSIDASWQDSYKRQIEVYQWLLQKNGFKVSKQSYFVYCNGIADANEFNDTLRFKTKLIPYMGSDNSWVDKTLLDIKELLSKDKPPKINPDCPYCKYTSEVNSFFSAKQTTLF